MTVKPSELRKRLRAEFKEFIERPHRTKVHSKAAGDMLRDFFKQSRRGAADAWDLLDELPDKGPLTAAALKSVLRDQLVRLQSNRCCFCRRWLVNTAYARPIEHILPRSPFKQFSLHYWNLAIACTDCNSKKTNTVWGKINTGVRRYPTPESITDWFHPRFHDYDEHVRFLRLESNGLAVVVYVGLTVQGRALCEALLQHIAAKEMLIGNNPALNDCVNALNENGDRFNADVAHKLMEFQAELGASVVSKMASTPPLPSP